ncbi:hypothetical protein D3C73_992690 [compost metagenome]
MLATQQIERAGKVRIQRGLLVVAFPAYRPQRGTLPRGLVDCTGQKIQRAVVAVQRVRDFDLAIPTFAKVVLDGSEQVGQLAVVKAPVGGSVFRPFEVRCHAVAVGERQAGAQRRIVLVGLVAEPQRKQRSAACVQFGDAIDQAVFLLVPIDPGMLVFIVHHHPASELPIVRQGAGQVGAQAIAVPTSSLGIDAGLPIRRRALAHQVDAGGRRTHAAHQACRAAYDFNAVIHGGIAPIAGRTQRTGNAIDQKIGYGEPARPQAAQIGAHALAKRGDARGAFQGIDHAFQLLIVQPLAGNDRN